MSESSGLRAIRYAPQVVLATTLVAVMPILAVWGLRAVGVISSPWLGVVLALGLSLMASVVGSAYWQRRRGPGDLLFSELLVWGWLRRLRVERKLADAVESLARAGVDHGSRDGPSVHRKRQILERLAVALEAQDRYTQGHSRRVASHSVIVARRMGLSTEQVLRIRAAAAVHDVGKIRTPAEILNKPGRLTRAEFEVIKRHAEDGAALVASLEDAELTAIVRHHHERVDGSGYPSSLAGEQIPLGARIIAVADTFDAITSARPYRSAVAHKRAIDVLTEESGAQLDPVAVRAFLSGYSDKRAVVVWTLLASLPQRVLTRLRGNRATPSQNSFSEVVANTVSTAAIGLAAMAAVLVAGGSLGVIATGRQASSQHSVAAPNRTASGVGASASHPTGSAGASSTAGSARTRAAQVAGGARAAGGGALKKGSAVASSRLGQASPSGSSGKAGGGSGGGTGGSGSSSGGSGGQAGGGSGGTGGGSGASGGTTGSGSGGSSGGGSGGRSGSGSGAGSGANANPGSLGASVGASVGARVGNPGSNPVGGSVGAAVGNPGSTPIGGSTGAAVGSPGGSAGGSAGAAVGAPGLGRTVP